MRTPYVFLILLAVLTGGCGGDTSEATAPPAPVPTEPAPTGFYLTSTAFKEGGAIPSACAHVGGDRTPLLTWGGAPEKTKSFALVVHDSDAPGGDFTHWLVWNIPADATDLLAGTLKRGPLVGANDFGKATYRGPDPPPGPAHHYRFELSALDAAKLTLPAGARRAQLEAAMKGHTVAKATLTATYARK